MDSLPRRSDAAAEASDSAARKPEPTEQRPGVRPGLAGEQRSLWEDQPRDEVAAVPTAEPEPSAAAQEGSPAPETPQELIILNILAPRDRPFSGQHILDAATAAGMAHGEMQVFHYVTREAGAQQTAAATVFSMANLLEPGTFGLEEIDEISTPGVTLFMQLPGPLGALDALETMLAVGRTLAERLGGTLCDEGRNPLSQHSVEDLKEQILKFNLRLYTG